MSYITKTRDAYISKNGGGGVICILVGGLEQFSKGWCDFLGRLYFLG